MNDKKISQIQQFEEMIIAHLSKICPGMGDDIRFILWDVVEELVQRATNFSFEPNTTAIGSKGYRIKKYLGGSLDKSEDGIIRQHIWELINYCFLSICHHTAESLGLAPPDRFVITILPR